MDGDRDRDRQSTSSFGGPNNGNYYPFSSSAASSCTAASSMRCSTPSSWRSDGKMSTSTEKFLPVTLMYSYKNGNKILFLEAGKDFVDILLSFLSLPMGAIVRLLYGGAGGDSANSGLQLQHQLGPDHEEAIFRLFNSVDKMEDEKFCTSKKSLVDPPEASGFGTRLLRMLHLDAAEQQESSPHSSVLATSSYHCNPVYYSCGMVPHCVCITKKLGRRCPRHGRKMQAPCTFVEGTRDINSGNSAAASNHHSKPVETGYVKDVGKFYITDSLGIYPGSKSLALLHKLKIERMSLLSSIDLFIGMDEILRLLKASLVSPTVLQDVFGRLVQTRLPPPLAPPSSIISTTTNTCPPAPPPPSIVSTTTGNSSCPTPACSIVSTCTNSSPPVSSTVPNASKGFNKVVAFAYDRNRPKYDDYFPRPNCKSLMFW